MRINANVLLEVADCDNKIIQSYAAGFSREAKDKQSIEDGYMNLHSFALNFAESTIQTCGHGTAERMNSQFERSCV